MKETNNAPQATTPEQPDEQDLNRRQALERMGRYAGYTAPSLMTLLVTKKAVAASLGLPPPPP